MALIKRAPLSPNFNIVGYRTMTLAFATFMVLASLALFAIQGLNFGVDFRGGILIEVRTEGEADIAEIRQRLQGLNLGDTSIQSFGAPTDVLINIQEQEGGEAEQMAAISRVREALDDVVADYRRTEFVGPTVGAELQRAGMLATTLALGAMAFYIWFRFEWHFAIAALVALIHDVIATIGFFALTQLEFNLGTLAAILTIAGYSINDTVVVFDRVRESIRRYKRKTLPEVLNISVNATLVRTVLTSGTTLIALFALAAFGGPVIRSFVWALIWGVGIGTFSSIALAVPLLIYLGLRTSTLAKQEETEKETAERLAGGKASS